MKRFRGESLLILIVGILAATGGAYWFIRNDFREASVWSILWNLFRLVIGTTVIVFSLKDFFRKRS